MQNTLKAYNLHCNGLTFPKGIDNARLQFSWKLQSKTAEQNQYQLAYQIKVFDYESRIVFDSQKIASINQTSNYHNVEGLKSNEKYLYTVIIWNKDDYCGEESYKAEFITGILNKEGWIAEFINAKDIPSIDMFLNTVWYRKSFDVSRKPRLALAHIASVGIHELYINGKKVGDRLMAPSRSNLAEYKRTLSVTYDITELLNSKGNTVGVWLDAGWTRQSGVLPGLFSQLEIIYDDGTQTITTDSTWKCKASNIFHIGGNYEWFNFGGERVEYTENNRWSENNIDTDDWLDVNVEKIETTISNDIIEGDFVLEVLRPVSVKNYVNLCLIDMGKNYTGWEEISFSDGETGDVIEILTADKPTEDMSFNQRSEFVFTQAKGVFCNKFNYAAGRYITIKGIKKPLSADDVKGLIVGNKFEKTASFKSSLELQNQIYNLDIDTFTANTINGVTSDCPHRERLGYGETGISNTWGIGLHNFETNAYYKHVFRNWRDVQYDNGYMPHVTPNCSGGGGITWGSSHTVTLADFFEYTKDIDILKENFNATCKWADYLLESVENGILQCPHEEDNSHLGFLGDWAYFEGNDFKGTEVANFFNNCVATYVISKTVYFADILNQQELKEKYQQALDEMRTQIHKKYFDREKMVYFQGEQRYVAVALCAGVVPNEDKQQVINNYISSMKEKKYMDAGSAGTVFVYRALGEIIKDQDLLFQWLQSTECPSYGYFIKNGHNTIPEVWDISDFAGGSRIHTCFSGIAGWYTRYLVGLTPAENLNTLNLKPFIPNNMNKLYTINDYGSGPIRISYSKTDTGLKYQIEIPINTTINFFAPNGYEFASKNTNTLSLGSGMNTIDLIMH